MSVAHKTYFSPLASAKGSRPHYLQ